MSDHQPVELPHNDDDFSEEKLRDILRSHLDGVYLMSRRAMCDRLVSVVAKRYLATSKRESVEYVKGSAIGVACMKHDLTHHIKCGYCYECLLDLVKCLLTNAPDDLAADGGITVLDVWRKEAQDLINQIEGGSE